MSVTRIDARGLHYRELNQRVREEIQRGTTRLHLANVNGQRYLADGLVGPLEMEIEGVAGNDLGVFMDGPQVRVRGNAQDAVGNTMNSGRIAIHGHAGDVIGYGMRGGTILVRHGVGYRVGIHMKSYRHRLPAIVVGGTAGAFLGEYLAGGLLVVLGLERQPGQPLTGDYCATGMHGGAIFLRGEVDRSLVATGDVRISQARPDDLDLIRPYLDDFAAEFAIRPDTLLTEPFWKLEPRSHRPYGSKYA